MQHKNTKLLTSFYNYIEKRGSLKFEFNFFILYLWIRMIIFSEYNCVSSFVHSQVSCLCNKIILPISWFCNWVWSRLPSICVGGCLLVYIWLESCLFHFLLDSLHATSLLALGPKETCIWLFLLVCIPFNSFFLWDLRKRWSYVSVRVNYIDIPSCCMIMYFPFFVSNITTGCKYDLCIIHPPL